MTYRLNGDVMTILHTRVDPALEGQGVAGRLVQAALDHARSNGLKVDPVCGYASKYMQRRPDTEALRAPAAR